MRQLEHTLLVIAVMMATIMEVLDMTIINVSLQSMGGELSATPSQMSWAMTSYILASAIAMPLTGFFTDNIGRKQYLLLSMCAFVLMSLLCAVAQSLEALILFRFLQGVFGASLVPISQAVMVDMYPPKQRGKAMAIWGSGIMIAPIMGPVLGGWLTEHFSWRWAFLINFPVGIIAVFLTQKYMAISERNPRPMDWPGFIALVLSVSGIQYCLDKGHEEDWFESNRIRLMAAIALTGLIWLCIHIRRKTPRRPIFNPIIFANSNFVLSNLAMVAISIALFGSITLQPLYFQLVLGFSTSVSGQFMIPRGIASMFSMMLVSQLINRVDSRWLIVVGIFFGTWGTWAMSFYAPEASNFSLLWPTLLQGIGMGFIFIPFNSIAYSTLPPTMITEASGVYNLIRTLGNAAGISIVMLLYNHDFQNQWQNMGRFISLFNPNLDLYLSNIPLPAQDPVALSLLSSQLALQSQTVALLNAIRNTSISFVLIIPFLFALKPSQYLKQQKTLNQDHI